MHVSITVDLETFETALEKLHQLEALLAANSGPGFRPFRALDQDLQYQLITLAADLAHEARLGLATIH